MDFTVLVRAHVSQMQSSVNNKMIIVSISRIPYVSLNNYMNENSAIVRKIILLYIFVSISNLPLVY